MQFRVTDIWLQGDTRANPSGQAVVLLSLVLCCAVAVAQTQTELNEGISKSFKAVSVELSKAIESYRQRLPEGQLKLFDRSQQAWEEYRRSACAFESSGVSGGSALPLIQVACLETLTRERLRYIQRLSACQEGDLSCPAWKKE
jgi:uncharacterized protein YecT (DUF1311 family)